MTPEQYYSNEDNYGSYQFMTLKEIIDAMLLRAMDDDSYLKTTKRSQMIMFGKECIRKFTLNMRVNVKAFEITVDPSTLTVILPQDYVDYARVSVVVTDEVTGSLRLQPLDINRSINTAIAYLQDNDYQILFDNDGDILTADGDNAYNKPYKKYAFCEVGGQSFLDTSKLSRYGEFKITDKNMVFSSDLSDKNVVIEYISDGLEMETLKEEQIKVHKYMEMALKDWIYYACIEYKRNVPANEKYRALQRFKASKHKMDINMSSIDLLEINRIMRQKTMWLK